MRLIGGHYKRSDMNANTKIVLAVIIGIVVGAGGFAFLEKDDMPRTGMHMMPGGHMMADTAMDMMMGDMAANLEGKTGDVLDETFLKDMIVHHEGAVDMAEAVLRSGKHEELKQMAGNIISAQTAEIAQMKQWLSDWYEN